jgi:hypothetical protein
MRGNLAAPPDERIEAEEEWFPVIFNHEDPPQNLDFPHPTQPQQQQPLVEEAALMNSPWIMFIFGLVIGALFGIESLIFILMAASNGSLLFGLFVGTCAHYAARYSLGMEIFG